MFPHVVPETESMKTYLDEEAREEGHRVITRKCKITPKTQRYIGEILRRRRGLGRGLISA